MALDTGGTSAGAVRAGGAVVEVRVQDLTKPGLESIKRNLQAAGKGPLSGIGGSLGKFAAERSGLGGGEFLSRFGPIGAGVGAAAFFGGQARDFASDRMKQVAEAGGRLNAQLFAGLNARLDLADNAGATADAVKSKEAALKNAEAERDRAVGRNTGQLLNAGEFFNFKKSRIPLLFTNLEQDVETTSANVEALGDEVAKLKERLAQQQLAWDKLTRSVLDAAKDVGLTPLDAQRRGLVAQGVDPGRLNKFDVAAELLRSDTRVQARKDFMRDRGLETLTLGLGPEAARVEQFIAAQKVAAGKFGLPGPEEERLRLDAAGSQIALLNREFDLKNKEVDQQFERAKREREELEALASGMQEAAFRGQLGMRGGYDYGGGNQYTGDIPRKALEVAIEQKKIQQQHVALDKEKAERLEELLKAGFGKLNVAQ